MWWLKLKTAFWVGLFAVGGGAILRAGANEWSRNVTSSGPGYTSFTAFDTSRYDFIRETGAWSIGFGLLVLALCVNQWVAGDPEKLSASPKS